MFQTFSKASSSAVTPSIVQIQNVKTKLGLTAWFVENHQSPVVSISVAFRHAGAKMDPENMAGLCAYLTNIIQEGAGEFDSVAFKEYLLEKNIQLSVSNTNDCFFISIRTVKENVSDALKIVRLMMTQPRFDERDCNRVRQQMLTFYGQMLLNENGRLKDAFHRTLYASHPYGKTFAQVIQDLPTIPTEALRTYIKNRLCQDALVISVAGDIAAEELSTLLDGTFSPLEEKAVPCAVENAPFLKMGTVTVEDLDIPQSLLVFAQPGIKRDDSQFFAALIASKILGEGGFESRLWNEIREKRGLTYGIGCQLNWSAHDALLVGQTSTKNESVKQVIQLIKQEWQKMADHGVSSDEVAFVKERLIGSFALGFSSTHQIAAVLTNYQLDHLPIDYINKRNNDIQNVSLEQVQAAIKTLINPEKLTFVVVGKPDLEPKSDGPVEALKPSAASGGGL